MPGHPSEACKGFATCIVFVRYFTEKAPFMHVGGRFHISWQEIKKLLARDILFEITVCY